MARRRSKAAVSAEVSASTLAPHAAQARAEELAKERARLLREVQKKQRQLEQVKQSARDLAERAVGRMAPILERQRKLAHELSALFDELLAGARISARARKQLERLRRSLELQGVLEPRYAEDEDDEETDGDAPFERGTSGSSRGGPSRDDSRPSAGSHAPREVAGARQVGQQRRSLRDIFRSLARAIHPDQARQEDERERRTEVMKQVTRAYEDGDLARLIELESAWQSEQAVTGSGDSEERCRELERLNRELLDQLREVTRQLRDAKRELAESELSYPPEDIVELAHLELDDVEGICELLRSFRDGRISISDLTDGPLPRPRRRKSRRA
ncbi:MAG: heat shock protein DnaJ-like protein [Polyangiaceae bacterium]|jgi:hypothetical protein|nr:heat shock protein DnaJ-like protein [Polyangiaceae bacterium]